MACPHLPSFGLVSQATSLSQHLVEQEANTCRNRRPYGRHHGKFMPTQHQKSYSMISRRLFLLKKNVTLSISLGKKLEYLHIKDFLKYKCVLYLKQPLTPPQRNIIVAHLTSNHRLAIGIGRWSTWTIPISTYNKLCHFCSYYVVENEALFVLKCPLYKSIGDKYQITIWEAILGSLRSFFQLDHQFEISLYLTEATTLHHARELATLTPSWCIFSLISLSTYCTLKSSSFHWEAPRCVENNCLL